MAKAPRISLILSTDLSHLVLPLALFTASKQALVEILLGNCLDQKNLSLERFDRKKSQLRQQRTPAFAILLETLGICG